MQTYSNSRENAQKIGGALIAESQTMKDKLFIISGIAETDSSVWLAGDAGTGKKFFAKYIHEHSSRRTVPFVSINCALFGRDETEGLSDFFIPERATVFFEEISCLSLEAQGELLLLLKNKGTDVDRRDLRFIVSTKNDIESMVASGTFLRELYYKLNVLPIFLPPLQDRKEDILPLAECFLIFFALDAGKNIEGFSEDAKEALLAYSWPGNIRELKNFVERAVIYVGDNTRIYKDALFQYNISGFGKMDKCDLRDALDIFKTFFISKVLSQSRWNQTEAAAKLGIQRTYLSKLMKDLDIKKSKERG